MAVAVKNKAEAKTSAGLKTLPVRIVLGVLYVLLCLAIIFPLLDLVWWYWLGLGRVLGVWAWALRFVAGAALAVAAVWLGLKLLGKEPTRGLKSGIAVGVVGFFAVVLLTEYIGSLVEAWVYGWTSLGATSLTVGVAVTAAIGVGLLVGLFWLIFNPRVDRALGVLEDQNWFTVKPYKSNQGQKVRRGTVLGILIIVGAGILALNSSLQAAGNWTLTVPFTGEITLTPQNVGDNPEWRPKVLAREKEREDWAKARENALAEVDAVLALPDQGRNELKPQLDELAAASPAVRQRLDQPSAPRPLGEKNPADVIAEFKDKFGSIRDALTKPEPPLWTISRFAARDANDAFKKSYARVVKPNVDAEGEITDPDTGEVLPQPPTVAAGQAILREDPSHQQLNFKDLEAQEKRRKELKSQLTIDPPEVDDKVALIEPEAVSGLERLNMQHYFSLVLLPALKYSAPVLLGLLGLWFAWRVVNMPAFGDFLIATEAELNKVSWTTKKRLIQDTVVVLVTVILLTFFLFFADILWSALLRAIGVLHTNPAATKQEKTNW